MTMLASMRNRLAALEESMPGIGEWWYSPNVITYTGGVNSKAFARVNFNDDLSKTVYAALYAKIGDSLSSGAADGFFNCKKLAERFPLAYGANFALRSWGGTAQATIHAHNLPASAITFVSRTAEQWSIGVWDSHGAGYGGVPLDQQGNDLLLDRQYQHCLHISHRIS